MKAADVTPLQTAGVTSSWEAHFSPEPRDSPTNTSPSAPRPIFLPSVYSLWKSWLKPTSRMRSCSMASRFNSGTVSVAEAEAGAVAAVVCSANVANYIGPVAVRTWCELQPQLQACRCLVLQPFKLLPVEHDNRNLGLGR
jgi:hypothetical protein